MVFASPGKGFSFAGEQRIDAQSARLMHFERRDNNPRHPKF
jgi:hypothetical protein